MEPDQSDIPGPDGERVDGAGTAIVAGSGEQDLPAGLDAALRRVEGALAALGLALDQRHQNAERERQRLAAALDAARAENARLEELLKAERVRVQRLENLTAAVSGRVDSAIGELETILES